MYIYTHMYVHKGFEREIITQSSGFSAAFYCPRGIVIRPQKQFLKTRKQTAKLHPPTVDW